MIYGHLDQWDSERNMFSAQLVQAIDYLKAHDFSEWELGKYVIDGDNIFAVLMEYETQASTKLQGESHIDYIDVQCVLNGQEIIMISKHPEQHEISEDLTQQHDTFLYKHMIDESRLFMKPSHYAVFFPDDIHKPAIQNKHSEKVRKIVIKIKRME